MGHPCATRAWPAAVLAASVAGCATRAPVAPAAPEKPKPVIEKGGRLADMEDPRYKPTIPAPYNESGKVYRGQFNVCVSDAGKVSGLSVIATTGVPELDAHWMKTIETWPYRPYRVNGRPVPYCHPLNLEVVAVADSIADGSALDGAKMLPPAVGASLRQVDVINDPRYRPRLPEVAPAGTRVWGLYKVCVDRVGKVGDVSAIKPADPVEVSDYWKRLVGTWPHRPYLVKGAAVPYCYPLRIEVTAK